MEPRYRFFRPQPQQAQRPPAGRGGADQKSARGLLRAHSSRPGARGRAPANPAALAQARGDRGRPPRSLRCGGAWRARTVHPRLLVRLRSAGRAAGVTRAPRAEARTARRSKPARKHAMSVSGRRRALAVWTWSTERVCGGYAESGNGAAMRPRKLALPRSKHDRQPEPLRALRRHAPLSSV